MPLHGLKPSGITCRLDRFIENGERFVKGTCLGKGGGEDVGGHVVTGRTHGDRGLCQLQRFGAIAKGRFLRGGVDP